MSLSNQDASFKRRDRIDRILEFVVLSPYLVQSYFMDKVTISKLNFLVTVCTGISPTCRSDEETVCIADLGLSSTRLKH